MRRSGDSKAATIISEILLTVEISNISILDSCSGVRLPSLRRRRAISDRAIASASRCAADVLSSVVTET